MPLIKLKPYSCVFVYVFEIMQGELGGAEGGVIQKAQYIVRRIIYYITCLHVFNSVINEDIVFLWDQLWTSTAPQDCLIYLK